MDYTVSEVLQFVQENDVKFVRLAFCDLFGMLKNIAIMADELPRAFERGVTFDGSAVRGFMHVDRSDLLLFPDPATLTVLPWRPQQGRVARFFCNICYPDGTPFDGNGRYLLIEAVEKARRMGLSCKVGAECEFYLFETDERGKPTRITQDEAGYLDVLPLDKGENVRRDICLTLEQMGVHLESSHHEQGPGQNEIDFRYSDALCAADDLIAFKMTVKAVAAKNGLYASFMPKPLKDASGSGLHINLSLFRGGENIFRNNPHMHSPEAESFIEGIMRHVREITAFLNPLTNSYRRLGKMEAPAYITWSHQNRSQLVRIPPADGEFARMELRSPDPSCNPYITYALLLFAGLEGIEQKYPLRPSINTNVYHLRQDMPDGIQALPKTLEEAVELAGKSEFLQKYVPDRMMQAFLAQQREDCAYCAQASDSAEAEHKLYFQRV